MGQVKHVSRKSFILTPCGCQRNCRAQARAAHPVLDKMVTMREELRQLWLNTSRSREQLAVDLAAWCRRAEESGIAALQEFSIKLRAVRA